MGLLSLTLLGIEPYRMLRQAFERASALCSLLVFWTTFYWYMRFFLGLGDLRDVHSMGRGFL